MRCIQCSNIVGHAKGLTRETQTCGHCRGTNRYKQSRAGRLKGEVKEQHNKYSLISTCLYCGVSFINGLKFQRSSCDNCKQAHQEKAIKSANYRNKVKRVYNKIGCPRMALNPKSIIDSSGHI